MALDGTVTAAIVSELTKELAGGRIDKIYQPQKDEILLTVRKERETKRVLLSANPSHPRIHITWQQKENPISAPMFCMVLRKHIGGGKIVSLLQPNFERIIMMEIQASNEMGDMGIKKLIIEIMGKHSNIILQNEDGGILDAIKHISHEKSSVREVLPGKMYVLPPAQGKQNPMNLEKDSLRQLLEEKKGLKLQSALYQSFTGISPMLASEICFRAQVDPAGFSPQLDEDSFCRLFQRFADVVRQMKEQEFFPKLYYDPKTKRLIECSVVDMTQYASMEQENLPSVSQMLEKFYTEKDNAYHIQQKAHDMRRQVLSNIERCVKKKEIQEKTVRETKDMGLWKIYGELITANIYAIQKGQTLFQTVNFYDETMPEISIPLDPNKTPAENAQKYFSRYNKAKRTLLALEGQMKQNQEQLTYLEGVLVSIENATEAGDLEEIRAELQEEGFLKKKKEKKNGNAKIKKAKPLHFISSDGYDIYVGKSNLQNDFLTLQFAKSEDMWMHTKNIPGSHVIIPWKNQPYPEQTLIEGANLAAFFSKARNSSQVPVDYTPRKYVKKPAKAKPGMVIYTQNRTIFITPEESLINQLKQRDKEEH